MIRPPIFFLLVAAILAAGCATHLVHYPFSESAHIVSLREESIPSGLVVVPVEINVKVGEPVMWHNHTTFEVQIAFSEGVEGPPRFIAPLAMAQGAFSVPGRYEYAIRYANARSFGKMSGVVVVGGIPGEAPPEHQGQ